jgi:hypothetical protein
MHNVGLGAATETLRKEESRQMRNLYLGNPGLKPQTWVDEQAYERPSAILVRRSGSGHDAHQTHAPSQGTLSADEQRQPTDKLGARARDHGLVDAVLQSPRTGLWASRRTRQSEQSFRLQVVSPATRAIHRIHPSPLLVFCCVDTRVHSNIHCARSRSPAHVS